MKKIIITIMLALFAFNAQALQWTGNVNFYLGKKSVDSEDWAPVDDPVAFGVMVDFKESSWPVSIALDVMASYDEMTESGIKFEGTTSEFNAGVRKIWQPGGSMVRPYIGGGLAIIGAEFKGTGFNTVSDDDTAMGIWLNGGIYWTLGRSFNIGLDLRYSQAEVTLFGVDGEAGGGFAGLLLGYHW